MLKVDHEEVNLGSIKFGKTYFLKYSVTNNYDKIVTINKVYGGCSSCTKAKINRSVLAPGETAEITAEFTPGSKGIQSKQIYVSHMTENFHYEPQLVLKIKAVVDE